MGTAVLQEDSDMYKAILVPLDGSAVSEQALPAAVALTRRTGARLHLVQVVSFRQEKEEEYLREVSGRVCEDVGESVDFRLVEERTSDPLFPPSNAEVATALRRYCEENDIQLVVMSTHGRGALRRAWLGSVADTVIRGSRLPVLLVRPGTWKEAPDGSHFRRIIVPLDGSESAARVVAYAAELAQLEHARVTLIRIVPPPVLLDAPYWVATTDEAVTNLKGIAREELEKKVEQLRLEGLHADAVIEIGPEPAAAILEYVEAEGIDLIAMTSRGRSKWERLLLGSVAERVLHHARTPVLLFPPVPLANAEVRGMSSEVAAEV